MTVASKESSTRQVTFRAENLVKVYDTGSVKVEALRGVSMELYRGEIAVLLGPSGSGKSTLLNILGGLDVATSGRVMFDDLDLTAMTETALTQYRRVYVGFVFQFYNLIPSLTARENVALVTEIADNPMRPEEALDLVGLKPRMDHFPAELSGGEQQRVAIARAIAKRPQVLLCDEPTGALDSKTGIRVIEALVTINDQLGTTTAIITHNAPIKDVADRVIYFLDGQIARVEDNAHGSRRPSWSGRRADGDCTPRPEAASRSLAYARPGDCDRAGDRGGRGDDDHRCRRAPVAERDAPRLLRALSLCRRVCPGPPRTERICAMRWRRSPALPLSRPASPARSFSMSKGWTSRYRAA